MEVSPCLQASRPMKFHHLALSSAFLMLATGCQSTKVSGDVPSLQDSSPGPAVDSSGKYTTRSGLQYKVLASGPAEGRSPTRLDSVVVHYRGTLTDGTVFDSSIDRGQPATFPVAHVIPGWTEALQLMKPGDEWVLFIPARLAYGSQGAGAKIPPNSDLIFQVRLLQIVGAY